MKRKKEKSFDTRRREKTKMRKFVATHFIFSGIEKNRSDVKEERRKIGSKVDGGCLVYILFGLNTYIRIFIGLLLHKFAEMNTQ